MRDVYASATFAREDTFFMSATLWPEEWEREEEIFMLSFFWPWPWWSHWQVPHPTSNVVYFTGGRATLSAAFGTSDTCQHVSESAMTLVKQRCELGKRHSKSTKSEWRPNGTCSGRSTSESGPQEAFERHSKSTKSEWRPNGTCSGRSTSETGPAPRSLASNTSIFEPTIAPASTVEQRVRM